jgi:hypothetical protein
VIQTMHTDKEWDNLSGKLKRIVIETHGGEWVDKGTYICLINGAPPYDAMHVWEVWQEHERGFARLIAKDWSAMYRNPDDAIAAAKRTLAVMGYYDNPDADIFKRHLDE